MAEPLIKKTGFWADGINGLLLRKPYRTYSRKHHAPVRVEKDSPFTVPAFKDVDLDMPALTQMLDEHLKAIQKLHPYAKTDPRHAKTDVPQQKGPSGFIPLPDGFPARLWERSRAQHMTDETTPAMKLFPEYILEALEPSTFATERLKLYDFGSKDTAIVASVVKGIDVRSISTSLQVSQDYISNILNRAYETFGVRNPEGLQAAFSWLASVEAENVAHSIRQSLESTVVRTGSREQEGNRSTASHGPEPESESRNRRHVE